jgi:type I restriction enzyme, S subunit
MVITSQSTKLKQGYKLTEVGVIPEEWNVKPLKQLSPRQCVGVVVNPSSYFDDEGTVPFLVGSNVGENSINWRTAKRISDASNQILGTTRLAAGDLVTVRVGEPGVTAVIPPELDGCNCASMMIVRQHPSFDSHWLCWVMNSRIGRLQVDHVQYGTAQKQFNISDAIDFCYPVPPLPEQRAIAEALSDIDYLIASLDRLIAKNRDIKQATMQQLLIGKTRLPGFSGEWEVKKLKNECELITKGTTPTSLGKNFSTHGINFIKIESLTDEGYIIRDKLAFIDKGTHNLLRRSQLKDKDILFSIAGALGRTALVKHDILPANTNQALALIRLKDQSCLDHLFLTKYLTSPEIMRHIGSINVQAAQANLSLEDVRNFEIRVPAIPEQRAIVNILSDMDAEIAALEQKRDKTRALKQGMMQELLTGKTRLL